MFLLINLLVKICALELGVSGLLILAAQNRSFCTLQARCRKNDDCRSSIDAFPPTLVYLHGWHKTLDAFSATWEARGCESDDNSFSIPSPQTGINQLICTINGRRLQKRTAWLLWIGPGCKSGENMRDRKPLEFAALMRHLQPLALSVSPTCLWRQNANAGT